MIIPDRLTCTSLLTNGLFCLCYTEVNGTCSNCSRKSRRVFIKLEKWSGRHGNKEGSIELSSVLTAAIYCCRRRYIVIHTAVDCVRTRATIIIIIIIIIIRLHRTHAVH